MPAGRNNGSRLHRRIVHDVFYCFSIGKWLNLWTYAVAKREAAALVGSTDVPANVSVSKCRSPRIENCSKRN